MEQSINERLACVISKFGYKSVRQLANAIGIAPTSLNDVIRNGAEPRVSTIEKILKAEPSISAEWLLRGEGEMLKSSLSAQSDISDSLLVEDLKAEINQLKGENRILREQLGLGERKDANKSA